MTLALPRTVCGCLIAGVVFLLPGYGEAPEAKGEHAAGAQDSATARELLESGPFQLRALEPSERPRLTSLTEPKRFAALAAARSVSIFAARGERESFGAVVERRRLVNELIVLVLSS
jgi:hypothetical protein